MIIIPSDLIIKPVPAPVCFFSDPFWRFSKMLKLKKSLLLKNSLKNGSFSKGFLLKLSYIGISSLITTLTTESIDLSTTSIILSSIEPNIIGEGYFTSFFCF